MIRRFSDSRRWQKLSRVFADKITKRMSNGVNTTSGNADLSFVLHNIDLVLSWPDRFKTQGTKMNIWQDDRWFDLVCWSWNWFSFRDKVAGAARETVMVLWTLCFPSTRRQTHRCGRHVCHHIDWKGERRQAVIGPAVCHDSLSRHGMNVSLLLFVFSVKEPRQNLQLLYSPAQTHTSHIYSPVGKNI